MANEQSATDLAVALSKLIDAIDSGDAAKLREALSAARLRLEKHLTHNGRQ